MFCFRMVCTLLTADGQKWTCVATQTLCKLDCEQGWKEELKYWYMFTVVTITTLPFHSNIMRSPTQFYLLAKISHEGENSFPAITHAVSCPSPLVIFLFFLLDRPLMSALRTTMVLGNPEYHCAIFPPRHLFSGCLSITKLSVCLPIFSLA